MNSYEEQRAAQVARLDAYMREHPPTPDHDDHPDTFHDPDDPAEAHTSVGSWPLPPIGAPR